MSFVKNNIIRILNEAGVEYKLIQHEHIVTSQDACRVRGNDLSECTKSLLFRTKEGKLLLAVCPGNKRVDTDRITELEGTKRIRLASPEEVEKQAGCTVGSVGPFGLKRKFDTYMDRDVLKNEYCFFSIGTHTDSIKMRTQDLVEIVQPVLI